MKLLLKVTAVFEGITGLALAVVPASVIQLILGSSPARDTSEMFSARIFGLVLIVIAAACWLAKNDSQESIMLKVITGYNILAMAGMLYAALVTGVYGVGLWPAVLAHIVLLIWCVFALVRRSRFRLKPE
jgi:uncharacterized membrane protein YfcA